MSLFWPNLPIDRDELEWQLATFEWPGLEFGSLESAVLILPTPDSSRRPARPAAGASSDCSIM